MSTDRRCELPPAAGCLAAVRTGLCGGSHISAHGLRLGLLAAILVACAAPAPGPGPHPANDWDAALQAARPFGWRLEAGTWDACTVVVRARRGLTDEDADELDAVLTDWYNLARLSAFKDDPRQGGPAAAEAMSDPWLPAADTLAVTFHLGGMPRSGLVVLLNALEGYAAEQTPLAEVVLCAQPPPPAAPPRRGTA